MNRQKTKIAKVRRHKRVRARMSSDAKTVVFRANQHIYAQIIDDASQKTIVASSSLELKTKGKKADQSAEVGTAIAKKALAKDISEVVFDRGGFKYHGRVKALADAARAAGLKF